MTVNWLFQPHVLNGRYGSLAARCALSSFVREDCCVNMYIKGVKNPNGTFTDSEHLSPEHVQSEFTVPRYLIKSSTITPPRALLVHRRGHSHCSASRLFLPHYYTPLPHLQAIAKLQGEHQESCETGSCIPYPPQ